MILQTLVTLALLVATPALAAPINVVSPGSLTTSFVVTFDDIAEGNYDGVLVSDGVSFAERFDGQTLGFDGDFDVLSGTPNDSLTLQTGAANQNLYMSSQFLNGLGPLGYPDFGAIGEGAMAALFPADQSQLAIDIVGVNGFSTATIDFFRRDGSLIQRSVLDLVGGSTFFGFAREGDVFDIAGFSIYNDDVAGMSYSQILYNACSVPSECQVVPEPGTGLLVMLGLIGLVAGRRVVSPR